MAETLVRANALSRSYRAADRTETIALRSATFEIAAKARIAVMGPSGSGKTTLMHLVAGLDAPTLGEISCPALGAREGLRPSKIALAFQGPSMMPSLDVAENVAFPLLLAGVSEADAADAAAAMLDRMNLSDLSRSLSEELSGGQAQRVGLARALVVRPALLLADEPTGQQDRAHADELLALMLDVCAEIGAAVLVSTHDPDVADNLVTRWTIRDGILATGGD
jgi:ABC-type lipoprotein export system ATPase subunit